MGLVDILYDVVDWIGEKIEAAVDWVEDKLSGKKYDENVVEDHVDVDAVLAKFRADIEDDVAKKEKECMDTISLLFSDLIEKTKGKFPDLVEIIENEQEKAEDELKGTVIKYVREHLSKNDSQFLKVLKMSPGKAKNDALDAAIKRVLENAEKAFDSKLKKYAEHLLEEFTSRLNTRITDREKQMNRRIGELGKLQAKAEMGQMDIDALKDNCAPIMECAECIIHMLGREM